MYTAVTDFLSWCVNNVPLFLWSHPVIDFLAIAVGIWVLALLFRLLFRRFN